MNGHCIDDAPCSGGPNVRTAKKKDEVHTLIEVMSYVSVRKRSQRVHIGTMNAHRTLKNLKACPYPVTMWQELKLADHPKHLGYFDWMLHYTYDNVSILN